MIRTQLDLDVATWTAKSADYKTAIGDLAEAVRRETKQAVFVHLNDGTVAPVVVRGAGSAPWNVG